MMTFTKKTFLSLATLILLGACSTNNGKYAAISDRPMTLYTLTKQKQVSAASIEAKSSRAFFLIIPTGDHPSIEEAVSEALRKYEGDYIANADITHTSFNLLWLYHYSTWKIRGDVVRIYQ